MDTIKYCNISISYGMDCEKILGTSGNMNISNIVTTSPINNIPGVNEYCYSASASYGNETITIEGNLNIIIDSGKYTAPVVL